MTLRTMCVATGRLLSHVHAHADAGAGAFVTPIMVGYVGQVRPVVRAM